jgi:hypothetical protein
LQPEYTWTSIVQTTGEEPISGHSGARDLGGQQNRILELPVKREDALSPADIQMAYEFLGERHYGHAGRRYLQALADLDASDRLQEIRARCASVRRTLTERTGLDSEHTSMVAALATASYLAAIVVFEKSPSEALAQAIEDGVSMLQLVGAEREERSLVQQAQELLQDYRMQFPGKFWDANVPPPKGQQGSGPTSSRNLVAFVVGEEVWFVPSAFKEIFEDAKMSWRRVLHDLKQEGRLICEKKTFTCQRESARLGAGRRRYHVFPLSFFRDAEP